MLSFLVSRASGSRPSVGLDEEQPSSGIEADPAMDSSHYKTLLAARPLGKKFSLIYAHRQRFARVYTFHRFEW